MIPEPYLRANNNTRKYYITIPVPKELQGCTFNGKTYGPQIFESTKKEDLGDARLIAVQRAYYWAELFIRQKQELGLLLSSTEQAFLLSRAPLSATEYLFQSAKPEHLAALAENAEDTLFRKRSGQRLAVGGTTDNDDILGGPTEAELEQQRKKAPPRPPRPIQATPHQIAIRAPQRAAQQATAGLMLKDAVDKFLAYYASLNNPAMLKGHKQALPLFLAVIGNKPVAKIKQDDIVDFFEITNQLPTFWRRHCKRLKLSVRALAAEDLTPKWSPKTWEDTYLASIRAFLGYAKSRWQDQGWPLGLTTEHIRYTAGRPDGEAKQRPLKPAEIQILLNNISAFAANPDTHHQYLLPLIGLFTGARVNEICQLNPRTDIKKDPETGVWLFDITNEGEGGEGVVKTTKNKESIRKVPIHQKLIEVGFLTYVERVSEKSKQLFPPWPAQQGRAAAVAVDWFRDFLKTIGLKDLTPGNTLKGTHVFRHTLMSLGHNQEPELDMTPITGHAGKDSPVARKYKGPKGIGNKKRLLESLVYPVDLSQLPKLQF